jgi:hypothetical protein
MQTELIVSLFPWTALTALGVLFFSAWQRERRFERQMRLNELEKEKVRENEETQRRAKEKSEADLQKYIREKKEEEEEKIRNKAGIGTGGYIIMDLPDAKRGLFHDLLKGFEEYARLQGYSVSFSVDNTFHGRIAFKFTLTDPDVVVGNERVRKDLKEYLEKVSAGDPLDDLPQIISIEEHEILVTTLRNRISFLQHSYNLAKNSVEFYEGLIHRASFQPLLPSPSVVVQTGGAYNAPSYSALNSPQAVLGIENRSENSINIAVTYKERKEQIYHIEKVLGMLSKEPQNTERDKAIRSLENIKEELEHVNQPEPGRVLRWLERAKQTVQLGSLGYETVQAAKELFKVFGLG